MRCWYALAFAVVLARLSAVSGQPPIEPKDGKYTVPLSVEAVGPAKPALKYRLLPELRDTQPGNQITAFYKCFFEQQNLFFNKESTDKQQRWAAAPLKDLANERELSGYGGAAVKQAFYAARLDTVDWQITNQAKAEGVMLLLPDIQQMRMLTGVLKVRFRGELARGEFENGITTLQTMFALARTFNEHPTLIGHLVGLALASISLQCVEEFIQQPNAPNLFWSLMDLPAPFIDLRKGREGEKLFLTKDFDILRKTVPVTDLELLNLLRTIDPMLVMGADGKNEVKPSAWYIRQSKDKDAVAAAAERLKALGYRAEDLAKLPALQTVMMDDFAQYQIDLDEFLKWTNVPAWQVPADVGKKTRQSPFAELLPQFQKVLQAKVRVQQVIALLTAAEGVRAHAAANGGKLPEKLDAVKLPLPVDPVTGKPFRYELKGGKASIRGTPPVGREDQPSFNRVYEITVRK